MADKTLTFSLDDLDRLEVSLVKAEAIANIVGAADTSIAMDGSLGNSMWAITDFIGEARKIIRGAAGYEPAPAEV